MSRTLPRPRSLSPGKSVCEITVVIWGEATELFLDLFLLRRETVF
jgi:hypothetical protein